jgi:hypothetical protein
MQIVRRVAQRAAGTHYLAAVETYARTRPDEQAGK